MLRSTHGGASLKPCVTGRAALVAPAQRCARPHARGMSVVRNVSLENKASAVCDVPVSLAFALWDDRTLIPEWMPWIASVVVQEEDTTLSRWTLRTNQFGRDWELSWLARNLAPVKQQKIHWTSVPGSLGNSLGVGIEVPNNGQIRFYKRPEGVEVELTITYEVPDALTPFASALTPLVESILKADMERFAVFAKEVQTIQAQNAAASVE